MVAERLRWFPRRVGLLAGLLLLLGAIGESTQADASESFVAGSYPVTVQGSAEFGVQKITTEAGSIECTTAYDAGLGKASSALELAFAFSNCKAFGLGSAVVVANGCKFVLDELESTETDKFESGFGVKCATGGAITVTGGGCQLQIPAQAGLESVEIADNTRATEDIRFDPEVTGLTYLVTTDDTFCPFKGIGSKSDGTFTAGSETTLTGQSPGNPAEKIAIAAGELSPPPSLTFRSTTYPVTIHGSAALGSQVIRTEAGAVECVTSYHAEAGASSATLVLAPTFSSCQAFGFLEAKATATGCGYALEPLGQFGADEFETAFGVSCEAGKAISISAATCEIAIPAQAGLESVELFDDTAATPAKDITFSPAVAGLSYTVLKDGFLCPFNGTGAKTGATFTASSATTLTGQSPSNPSTKIGIELG